MLEFLKNNYEFLFGGMAGSAIVTFIGYRLKKYISKRKMKKGNDINKTNTTKNTHTLKKQTPETSIVLYDRLRNLTPPLFHDVCFHLKEKYHHDLGFADLNRSPTENAQKLIALLKQHSDGLAHLQILLDKNRRL